MQNMAKRDCVVPRPWHAARRWRNANSWLQDLETLLERTRNAARGRRNANSCSQDHQGMLEDLVVAEWQLPDSTLRASWDITQDHRARLVWSNWDFFGILEIYLQYLLSYILKFLICMHAGNPRVPPRVLTSGPKPCVGNNVWRFNRASITLEVQINSESLSRNG